MIQPHLLHLIQLADPSLPVGGFSHSAGLETYVHEGLVRDRHTAHEFISQQLRINIHYTDAALLSLSHECVLQDPREKIRELDALCHAVKLPMEIRMASNKMGIRLLKVYEKMATGSLASWYHRQINNGDCQGHYPIAFGLIAADLGIPKAEALSAFYYTTASGMVTNAVKLIPLGQQEGREILMSLFELINELSLENLTVDEDRIGLCCPGFDMRCILHEELYSRLYMS